MTFLTEVKSLVTGIAEDVRIPPRDKKILVIMFVLLISPFDFIPDFRNYGLLDDFIILSFIWDYFFNVLDSTLFLSHYPWTMKSYARLKAIANALSMFAPNFIKKKLWLYVGDPY